MNPEHHNILKSGVENWNKWREENPNIIIDLSDANLSDADLSRANLSHANLSRADLSRADLRVKVPPKYSHDFWAESIFREAGEDIERRKMAGLVLISKDWCWKEFKEILSSSEMTEHWNTWLGKIFWQYPDMCNELGLPKIGG